ncbi:MAG: AAA family ATPase [Candidatus Omnitrophota bacterium]
MLSRRFKMYMQLHWIPVAIVVVIAMLVFLLVWGLSRIESFYRQMQLVQIPLYILMGVINASVFVFMWLFFLRGGMTKIAAGKVKAADVDVKWDDVIGIDEAKLEAWEVLQLIKDRTMLQKIGGKIIRGILMVGPPGCGKTYLAKAIATEAKIPFLPMAASEFTEIFVGVGASKIRKLFKRARLMAYGYGGCIVFIDELDAIGRTRSFSMHGGGQETNTTQNQLLVEMDGLKDKQENVIVIGATNAAEGVLDAALLRPGRFDRKVYIDIPTLEGREKLFAHYLAKVKHENIDVGRLARKAIRKSPADIENIVKEAALITARNKKETVTMDEISEAIERIDMGVKRHRNMTPREREMTAYHESGHLLIVYRLHPTKEVFKASIVSRKEALGVVHTSPREEEFTISKEAYLADIKVALGGYVAEKLQYNTTSSGVSSDFKQAMVIAHFMVWRLGMGSSNMVGDYTVIPREQLSEDIRTRLNVDTSKILNDCIASAEELLKKEKHILDRLVKELLEKDELEYDEIKEIFNEYDTQKPKKTGA